MHRDIPLRPQSLGRFGGQHRAGRSDATRRLAARRGRRGRRGEPGGRAHRPPALSLDGQPQGAAGDQPSGHDSTGGGRHSRREPQTAGPGEWIGHRVLRTEGRRNPGRERAFGSRLPGRPRGRMGADCPRGPRPRAGGAVSHGDCAGERRARGGTADPVLPRGTGRQLGPREGVGVVVLDSHHRLGGFGAAGHRWLGDRPAQRHGAQSRDGGRLRGHARRRVQASGALADARHRPAAGLGRASGRVAPPAAGGPGPGARRGLPVALPRPARGPRGPVLSKVPPVRPAWWIALLVFGIALAWTTGAGTRWPEIYYMTDAAMEPTVRAGEYFLVWSPPRQLSRGDLVIFRWEQIGRVFHVLRRLAAFPGDTIAMREGTIVINRAPQTWPFRIIDPAARRSPL